MLRWRCSSTFCCSTPFSRRLIKTLNFPDGSTHVLVEGLSRCELTDLNTNENELKECLDRNEVIIQNQKLTVDDLTECFNNIDFNNVEILLIFLF